MTKITSTALVIGLAVGAGLLLGACQLPSMSQSATTSVTVEPTPSPSIEGATSGNQTGTTPSQPTPVTNTTVDQDLQSLDTLNKQGNPAVLGANSASNASLGVQ